MKCDCKAREAEATKIAHKLDRASNLLFGISLCHALISGTFLGVAALAWTQESGYFSPWPPLVGSTILGIVGFVALRSTNSLNQGVAYARGQAAYWHDNHMRQLGRAEAQAECSNTRL